MLQVSPLLQTGTVCAEIYPFGLKKDDQIPDVGEGLSLVFVA